MIAPKKQHLLIIVIVMILGSADASGFDPNEVMKAIDNETNFKSYLVRHVKRKHKPSQ